MNCFPARPQDALPYFNNVQSTLSALLGIKEDLDAAVVQHLRSLAPQSHVTAVCQLLVLSGCLHHVAQPRLLQGAIEDVISLMDKQQYSIQLSAVFDQLLLFMSLAWEFADPQMKSQLIVIIIKHALSCRANHTFLMLSELLYFSARSRNARDCLFLQCSDMYA